MPTAIRALLVTLSLCTIVVAVAQEINRLLPESFVKTVGVAWHQDGRVVEVTLSNPKDKWVLQRLLFQVVYQPEVKAPAPLLAPSRGGSTPPTTGASLGQYLDSLPEPPESHVVEIEIQPGKQLPSHLELKSNRTVVSLSLLEIRGREQSRLERVRGSLW